MLIAGFYPAFNNGRNLEMTVNAWQMAFADDDPDVVANAVLAFANTDTKGYAPVPGQLKALMHKADDESALSETAAWAMVYRALQNSAYGWREEYAKLPAVVQDVLGDARTLRDWAMADESEVQTVIASNFQRSFRARAQYRAEVARMPESVRSRLGLTAKEPEKLTDDRPTALPVGGVIEPLVAGIPEEARRLLPAEFLERVNGRNRKQTAEVQDLWGQRVAAEGCGCNQLLQPAGCTGQCDSHDGDAGVPVS
jgi:hypothetical protein